MPIAYKCRECGVIRPVKWLGKCPGCFRYFDIRQINADIPGAAESPPMDGEVVSLQDAVNHVVHIPRIETGLQSVDYVLGGGLVPNSIILLCGDPGSGKTTVLIQVLRLLAVQRHDVLYVTGEQTVGDLAQRAKSFGKFPGRFAAVRETYLDTILDHVEERQPAVVVIDSIQMINVDDDLEVGSAASIKAAIRAFTDYGKENSTVFIIIGHVTKGGVIGGPKALEHHVDVSLHLSGNKFHKIRYLKCDSKNRAGPTPRFAKFEMSDTGLIELDTFVMTDKGIDKVEPPEEDPGEVAEPDAPKGADAPPKAPGKARVRAKLVSVPMTPEAAPEAAPTPARPSPAEMWVAPDGTSGALVLAVSCNVPDCRGRVGRACTAENGLREAGFHQSRVDKGKAKAENKPLPQTKAPTPVEVEMSQKDTTPDPFAKKEGLTAKPRIKAPRVKEATGYFEDEGDEDDDDILDAVLADMKKPSVVPSTKPVATKPVMTKPKPDPKPKPNPKASLTAPPRLKPKKPDNTPPRTPAA